jgi:quinolinate synthase
MDERIAAARAKLGATTVILGHHYQRDEVVRFADFTGDSYKLSKSAMATGARYIVFCGVHFMAESADILADNGQQVILPDLNAGCSMADMAEISQVEDCWDALERAGLATETIPVTYINSTAAIKAFCGEHGGLVCTSSSARKALDWAFARGKRVLFLPDQHLGFRLKKWWSGIRGRYSLAHPGAGSRRKSLRRAALCSGRATAPCISGSCLRTSIRCERSIPASR